jgi:hypothetical protein
MAATDTQAIIEQLFEAVFSVRSVPSLYNEDHLSQADSIMALRVVGGDEREPSAWEYNWATLFLREINKYGEPNPPVWGSLESETVRYDYESHGTRTRE